MNPILRRIFFWTLCTLHVAFGQDTTNVTEKVEELRGAFEGLNETVAEMKTTVDALKKIKLSGYIQAQHQTAEGEGISSFSGGNFPAGVRDRFQVRRGRLKVNYDNDLTQYVLQIDVTQNGVGIKDAYASLREPWLRMLSFTAGVFDRPFGFEISYSSSSRESPERSRLFQTLFPGERELGAKVEFGADEGLLSHVNFKGGFFNGTGPTANENDRTKDFIGRAGFQIPLQEENLAIDGGVSLYAGKVTNNSKFISSIDKNSKQFVVDSTATNLGGRHGRVYHGADIQIYYDLPAFGGLSLRGEYIFGQQPGTATSNSIYVPGSTPTPLYLRKFSGWYVNYVQNVGLSHQLILKYDVLDPNSDVKDVDIGTTGTNLSIADIKHSTLGIGWVYHWDGNIKFVVYYDIVANEEVNPAATGALARYTRDLRDNVLTLRVQYRFP
jgi:hypothetical protein